MSQGMLGHVAGLLWQKGVWADRRNACHRALLLEGEVLHVTELSCC